MRWTAFVLRATLLCIGVLAVAAGPFWLWIGPSGLVVLGIGAGLELILIAISYAFLVGSFRRSVGTLYYAMLGGWVIRFGPTIAVLYALWKRTDLSRVALLVSVMTFYLTLLFYEAKVCWQTGERS